MNSQLFFPIETIAHKETHLNLPRNTNETPKRQKAEMILTSLRPEETSHSLKVALGYFRMLRQVAWAMMYPQLFSNSDDGESCG